MRWRVEYSMPSIASSASTKIWVSLGTGLTSSFGFAGSGVGCCRLGVVSSGFCGSFVSVIWVWVCLFFCSGIFSTPYFFKSEDGIAM